MSGTVEFISTHPLIAFIVMSIHLTVSIVLYELQIPLIVMQIFQIGAWTITILVGLVTLYKFIKKKK